MTTYNVTRISRTDEDDRVQVGEFKTARAAITAIQDLTGADVLSAHYDLGMCHFLTANDNIKVTW